MVDYIPTQERGNEEKNSLAIKAIMAIIAIDIIFSALERIPDKPE